VNLNTLSLPKITKNLRELPEFSREPRKLPWQPNLDKTPKLHKSLFLARNGEFRYAIRIFREQMALPWQPTLGKNKPKFELIMS